MDWEFGMASGGLLVYKLQCIDKQPRGIATSFFTLVALCALVLELWRGWREHERGEVRDVTSHLDLHAAPTAWRLVHGSWAHWRRAEGQGKAPVGLGRGAMSHHFLGADTFRQDMEDMCLQLENWRRARPRFLRLSRLTHCFGGRL